MKPLATSKMLSVLAITFCIGVFAFHHNKSGSDYCQAAIQPDQTQPLAISSFCKPSQQSWFSWLQGNSRSTQFHFVDLLELLNRFDRRG